MKYLSDLLYVDIDTASFAGESRTYEVVMTNPDFNGSSYDGDLTYWTHSDVIYKGRVYGTGKTVRIYLNDIIESHVYDNSYVYEPLRKETSDFTWTNVKGALFSITVILEDDTEYDVVAEPYIMNYYRDAKTVEMNNIDYLSNDAIPANYNLLMQRTNVLPRIPKLPIITDRFWVSGLFATNISWVGNAATATYLDNEFRIVGMKDGVINNSTTSRPRFNGLVQAFTLKGNKYYDTVEDADEIVFACSNQLNGNSVFGNLQDYTPIAKVDRCPAEYYLIWIDRTGAYQCQPFTGKNRLSESVSTSYITSLIGTDIVSSKQITNSFSLNSEWLTYDEYKAFESIFSSKFLYLYNTEYDEGYEVVLTNNEWTEKTKQNRDKMFNLRIDVKSARPQIITY